MTDTRAAQSSEARQRTERAGGAPRRHVSRATADFCSYKSMVIYAVPLRRAAVRWVDGAGDVWRRWKAPIAIGTVVGLITGLVGMLATELLFSTFLGGLVGAVGCGVTVASRSEERLRTVVFQALVADIVSSIAFFVLVYLAYIAVVSLTEGVPIIGAIYFALLYLVFGGLVAVPVAVFSLGITGVAAAVTLFLTRRRAESAALQ